MKTIKDLYLKFMLWCGWVPLSDWNAQKTAYDALYLAFPNKHKENVLFENDQFKIMACRHCNPQLLQIDTIFEINEDIINDLKEKDGVIQIYANKYMVQVFKGNMFTLEELAMRLVPALKYFSTNDQYKIS